MPFLWNNDRTKQHTASGQLHKRRINMTRFTLHEENLTIAVRDDSFHNNDLRPVALTEACHEVL